uniref:Uncharacterized protein n=1 Tax=Plectus sambesii TaxID=2011161 RepID=A0A914V5B3_9BILA
MPQTAGRRRRHRDRRRRMRSGRRAATFGHSHAVIDVIEEAAATPIASPTFAGAVVDGGLDSTIAGRLARGADRSLTIHAVRPSDAGIYQCTIKLFNRPADHPTGPRVELFVHSKPTIAEFATVDFYRAIGEQVVLECSADGSPKPAVQWLLDGRRVVDEQSRILIRDGRLEITDLKATDEGEYKCVASNDEGTAERSARISFAKAPHFEFAPRNRTALDGSSFFWRCDARADPNQLTYRWFFSDKEVKFSDLGLRSVIEEGDLRISPIHRSDSGWYRCVASNGFGAEASASAYLDVQYQAQVLSSTPQVQTLPLGLPADLHCDVDANPSASFVNWAKDGRVLSVGNDTRYDRVETGAALRITGVERSDAGLYTCQAYNAIGGSSPYEIHVLVSEPPFYTVTPEPNSYRREGEDVTLFCGGGGTPEPKIYWRRKDGRPLSARAKEEGRATLSINNIHYEDHGVYECIVQNDIATLSKEAVVVVDDTRPQQPTDVRAVSRVDGAHISWKPAFDGGHEQTFTIRYRPLDSSDAWQVVDAGQRSEFDVTNLRPSTTYEFLVEPNGVSVSSGYQLRI